MLLLLFSCALLLLTTSDAQQCTCFTSSGVNIRDTACGNVIGSGSQGQCLTSTGNTQVCELSGTTYTFIEFQYGSSTGWAASDFLTDGDCPDGEVGVCSDVTRVYREEWGARPPSGGLTPLNTPVQQLFIHHTVTAPCNTQAECEQEMQNIQDYHMDGRGYTDIGYNWLVGEDGQAYEGRGWPYVGAHTGGCNSVSVAISLIGNFEPAEGGTQPNAAIMDAARNLIDCAINEGIVVDWSQLRLYGHRDSPCAATACPGQAVYDIITGWPWYDPGTASGCVCA